MSDKFAKGGKGPNGAVPRPEPGKVNNDLKPKKAAAHRQVIEDAAKYNQAEQSPASGAQGASATAGDDYEGGKVAPKRKMSKYEEEIKMVQDLDRWG